MLWTGPHWGWGRVGSFSRALRRGSAWWNCVHLRELTTCLSKDGAERAGGLSDGPRDVSFARRVKGCRRSHGRGRGECGGGKKALRVFPGRCLLLSG